MRVAQVPDDNEREKERDRKKDSHIRVVAGLAGCCLGVGTRDAGKQEQVAQ